MPMTETGQFGKGVSFGGKIMGSVADVEFEIPLGHPIGNVQQVISKVGLKFSRGLNVQILKSSVQNERMNDRIDLLTHESY